MGPGARLVDRITGRVLGLAGSTSGYSVARGVRVPMRDGVELLADHYAPASPARGTILVRGPYGRAGAWALLHARVFGDRGYHVVLQSSRGTFGSGDAFEPMVREVDDGADTVAWLRRQPWFTGRFATFGGSYLGFTQWALLVDPPPELAAAIVAVGPHDFWRAVYGTGAFTLMDFLGWSELVARQEEGGIARGLIRQAGAGRRLAPVLGRLPVADAGEALLDGRAPWYRDWVSRPDPADPFWERMRLGAALERVRVPVLLFTGWQDLFLEQTLEQYARLRERGVDVALTAGPWTHAGLVTRGAGVLLRESMEWLAEHLAGTARRRRAPVRIFVTGADEWRDLQAWPPASDPLTLHLQPGGALAADPPAADAPPSAFTYDPADPTPTIGGRLLSASGAGYRDDSALAVREDVLSFTGPVLGEDLDVVGIPVAELAHRSDNPHADVFVRLCEVDAQDRSRNVSEALRRLDAADPGASVRLELDAIAHRFRAGNRIRLLVAGGSHPRFARNLGTDEPLGTGSRMAPSRGTIAHGAGGPSRVTLPIAATTCPGHHMRETIR